MTARGRDRGHEDLPLALSASEMRRLGERMVDPLLEHFEQVDSEPPILTADRGALGCEHQEARTDRQW